MPSEPAQAFKLVIAMRNWNWGAIWALVAIVVVWGFIILTTVTHI